MKKKKEKKHIKLKNLIKLLSLIVVSFIGVSIYRSISKEGFFSGELISDVPQTEAQVEDVDAKENEEGVESKEETESSAESNDINHVEIIDYVDYEAEVDNFEKTPNPSLHLATVIRVIDGDTLIANIDGEEARIRMLEIDTPESVHEDAEKNNEFGVQASNYTKKILEEGKTIYLQYGDERTDKYGRTLAYIWLTNMVDTSIAADVRNYMFNCRLINLGYARVTSYTPNTTYNTFFNGEMIHAMENNTGFWNDDRYWEIAGYEREELLNLKPNYNGQRRFEKNLIKVD